MSIRPIVFNKDGSVNVWHDEANHGGTAPADALRFTSQLDGSSDYRFLTLPCPVKNCGAVSTHPVSGGAAPEMVQELFIRCYLADKEHPAKTFAQAKAAVKAGVRTQDGDEFWRLETLKALP